MEQIIIFLVGMLFYYILDLIKLYINKRIENKARIDDLPQMTQIEEKERQKFRTELSSINTQLSILAKQNSIVDEKSVQVINNFFERCLEIKDLHSRNFGDFATKDIEQSLINFQENVEIAHRKLYSDYHSLVIFHIKNPKIIDCANQIVSSSHIVKTTFKTHFGKIKMAILKEIKAIGELHYKESVDEADKIVKDYYNDQKPNFELFNNDFNEFLKSISIYFGQLGYKIEHNELIK